MRLIQAGIAPSCGASLPGGPAAPYSLCLLAGRINGTDLHLDHTPPLRDEERSDWRRVCDPLRVVFYCSTCHNRKTQREQSFAMNAPDARGDARASLG